jgi:hypothetical protein
MYIVLVVMIYGPKEFRNVTPNNHGPFLGRLPFHKVFYVIVQIFSKKFGIKKWF